MDVIELVLSLFIIVFLSLLPLSLLVPAVFIWFIVSLILFIRAKRAAKKGLKKGNPKVFLVQMIIAGSILVLFTIAVVVFAVLLMSGVIPLM